MGILIVDDDRGISFLLETILQNDGYSEISVANSAREAASLLGMTPESSLPKLKVDLILMDVNMPEMDGITACGMIKADKQYKDLPIIMVTANTEESFLQTAFAAGAMDYITKPFRTVELLARVKSALKLKEETDKRKAREAELEHVTYLLDEAVNNWRNASLLDGLTGVANRQGFEARFNREYQRIEKNAYLNLKDELLSLILLDIDYFKRFNGQHGHAEGDHCLKKIAEILSREAGPSADMVARYDGDAFILMLRDTTADLTRQTAERIRAAVENMYASDRSPEKARLVTASLGVAFVVPKEQLTIESFISHADKALHEAKVAGRNGMRVYQD